MSRKVSQFGVTQKDIAEALNVSRACVAIALNPNSKSRKRLLPETIAKVEEKARELNYRPQRLARVLRSGRSHSIGVICQSGIYHAPQERVRHLARYAIQSGYQVVSIDMDWFERDIGAAQDYLLGMAVEGVVFCNISDESQKEWELYMQKRSIPMVSMNGISDTIDQIRVNMRSAFRDMTQHHLSQGARNLHLLLSFYDEIPSKREPILAPNQKARVEGFAEAIRSVGGSISAEGMIAKSLGLSSMPKGEKDGIRAWIHHPKRTSLHCDVVDLGYYETLRLFECTYPKPDSLICSNDHIAAGAIAACGEMGLRLPKEVLVSGSDNSPVARYRGVQLTTIAQPAERMAQWSIQRIVELIERPEERGRLKQELFPCELIFRNSTISSNQHQPSLATIP